jgi:calcium-dependent protein kinase
LILIINSEKVDVWSCGIVLYMMLSGEQPFDHENVPRLIQLITMAEYSFESKIWDKISEEAKSMI